MACFLPTLSRQQPYTKSRELCESSWVYSQRQRAAVIAIGCRCTAKRVTFQSGKDRIIVPIPMVESDCCDHGSKSYRALKNRDLGGTLARKSNKVFRQFCGK